MRRGDRRSIRLPEYDYSQPGAYSVTICVQGKACKLGEVAGGEMELNALGVIARDGWAWLGRQIPAARVDIFCVMPNHVHAIVSINETAGRGEVTSPRSATAASSAAAASPVGGETPVGGGTPPLRQPTLGQMVAYYKYETTKQINQLDNTPGARFWLRNYYEGVIRNPREYEAAWAYIENNPLNWERDEEFQA